MAYDSNIPRRDVVADRMAAMSRPVSELVVPEGLKGKLFSPRDLLAPTLAKADAELRAYLDASRSHRCGAGAMRLAGPQSQHSDRGRHD
jgi:hypothetical protein